MTIDIITVGKIKEPFVLEGIKHYKKYLAKFAKYSFKHITPTLVPKNASLKDIENIKIEEGKKLLSKIKPSYVIGLSSEGKLLNSESFARLIKDIQIYKGSKITFLIGGSHGLSSEVKKSCNVTLSLSKLTYPHQLTTLILTEQLFRAFKINNNESYHK